MRTTDVVVVGGGQAGLALSRCLTDLAIDHVVLERGRLAERWRHAMPHSLRLLTPNWMTRLPGWRYRGPEPDGFMRRDEVVSFLEGYAASFEAPVEEDTTVLAARAAPGGFTLDTTGGEYRCRALVVATGHCDRPRLPAFAFRMPHTVTVVHAANYRTPAMLPRGAVLVVGASSSGVQIADELARAHRSVILSAGRHIRMPRSWRGEDVFRWMDRAGILEERVEDHPNPDAAARQPSMQLVGRPERSDIDLATLAGRGVRIMGRLGAVDGDRLGFSDDLAVTTADADRRLNAVLDRFDAIGFGAGDARPAPVLLEGGGGHLSLKGEGISTVVFATGYGRNFDWLKMPATTADGDLAHHGGVTAVPGLYGLGFRMLRKRNSNFIDGVGGDAAVIAGHIADQLGQRRLAA